MMMKKLLVMFLIAISSVAFGQSSQLSQLDGEWYSTQWKYGYTLTNGVGVATSTNSPNFKVGDRIIFLQQSSDKTFEGTQVYTDGKFYKITVQQQSNDTLLFKGEKNVSWTMTKKTQTTAHATTSTTSTTTTPAAPLASASTLPSGQSTLPPCQGSSVTNWNMCVGTFTYSNGNVYVGGWKDGKRDGQGTLSFSRGDKYVGEWKDDKRNGKGTLWFYTRDVYVGEFKENEFNGQGTYTFSGGGTQTGTWCASELHSGSECTGPTKELQRIAREQQHQLRLQAQKERHAQERVEQEARRALQEQQEQERVQQQQTQQRAWREQQEQEQAQRKQQREQEEQQAIKEREPLRPKAQNDVVAQALNYVSGYGEDAKGETFYYPIDKNNGNCIFKSTSKYYPDIDLSKGNPSAIQFFTQDTQWGHQVYISRVEGLPEFRCNGCNGARVQRAWALIYKECKGTRKAF
jgi:hypothetical protein